MNQFANQIASAIQKMEEELIPRAKTLSGGPKDVAFLMDRLQRFQSLYSEARATPCFSVAFLGNAQNGKSTLINALFGRKVLPEGHTGACSSAIVRCRFRQEGPITATFTYMGKDDFARELAERIADARMAFEQEDDTPAHRREQVCRQLGRFLKLFEIDPQSIEDPSKIIQACEDHGSAFPEAELLGTTEVLEVNVENERRIEQNLSARGRTAFVVDKCLIEGPFPEWHPNLELVDMPGVNANAFDNQVTSRVQSEINALAMVTNETLLTESVFAWFKETPILTEIAGSSDRNRVRVFLIKTLVDRLEIAAPQDESVSLWALTHAHCGSIDTHFRSQVRDLIGQRFSAANELGVLNGFVDKLPIHFVSAKTYRNLADPVTRARVENNPIHPHNLELFTAFQRFDSDPENTGIPALRRSFWENAEEYVQNHHWKRLTLEFRKEVGRVADFFRTRRVGFERKLADESEVVLELDHFIREGVGQAVAKHRDNTEASLEALKKRFNEEVTGILDQVSASFAQAAQQKLNDWMQLHWASLRAAGRKNGQHMTSRGYEIDFNGELADFCVGALNSRWIGYRSKLREMVFDALRDRFIPEVEQVIAQAKGTDDEDRIQLVEENYQEVGENARNDLELQIERYNQESQAFDALRPPLMQSIRKFLAPTYEKITDEIGRGSSARMRNHLNDGVSASIPAIGPMVRDVVKETWRGLTAAIERSALDFLAGVEKSLNEHHEHLESVLKDDTADVTEAATGFGELEKMTAGLIPDQIEQEEAA